MDDGIGAAGEEVDYLITESRGCDLLAENIIVILEERWIIVATCYVHQCSFFARTCYLYDIFWYLLAETMKEVVSLIGGSLATG